MNKAEILNPFQLFTNSRPPCYRPTLFYKERARESKPRTQRAKKLVLFQAMVGNISSTTDPSSEYNLSIRRGRRRIRRSVSVQKVSFSNFLLWKSYFS